MYCKPTINFKKALKILIMYAIINVKYAFDIAIKKLRRLFMENNEFEKVEAKKNKYPPAKRVVFHFRA